MSVFEQRALNENHPSARQFDDRSASTHTIPPMADGPTREEIAAQLAAVEARTDAKLVGLSGKIDQVLTKIDGMNGRLGEIRTDMGTRLSEARADMRSDMAESARSTRNNLWAVGIGLAALIIAAAVAIPSFIDLGMKFGEIKQSQEVPKATKTP